MFNTKNCAVLLITLWICYESAYSIPTFTNEYVHIKLHVPEKTGDELLKNIQEIEHSANVPVVYHKVIHHFHKRKRPQVKYNFAKNSGDALESIVLSEETTQAHKQHDDHFEAAKNVETFVVKQHAPKHKQNAQTLKIIEEKYRLPSFEEQHQQQHSQHQHAETFKVITAKEPQQQHVETYKVVETKKNPSENDHHHHHTETYKILDDTNYKQHSQHNHHHHPFDYEPNTETYKIINDKDHYQQHPYATNFKIIETKLRPPPPILSRPATHTETVQIVKEKSPYTHHYKQSVELYHRPVIQTDSIQVSKPEIPYQHNSNNAEYTHTYVEKPSHTSGGYSYEHYPAVSNYKEEVNIIPKQKTYHSSHFQQGDYALQIPSSKYQPQVTHYLTTDVEPHSDTYNGGNNAEFVEKYKNYPTGNQYDFSRDEDLLSEILGATRNKNPTGYEYKPPELSQDVASGSNVDWPTEESEVADDNNRSVAETYSGVDSYSVNHVQGVGSGGYNYHSPFVRK